MLRVVADRVVLLSGWRRALTAVVAGATAVAALPPFGLLPALALAFGLLVWLVDGTAADRHGAFGRFRAAFGIGWYFGFGYFLAGLWWMGEAFLHQPDVFAWALPLGVAGLPAMLALFTAAGTGLARLLWSASPWRIAALAFGLGVSEWARGSLFTGFPWNAFGYALTAQDVMMQAASLGGVHALTVIAVFVGAAGAVLADPDTAGRRAKRLVPIVAGLLILAQLAYGTLRILSIDHDAAVEGVVLRIVQPNLTQRERLDPSRHADIVERYFRLGTAPAEGPVRRMGRPTHLFWPETALPFAVERAPGLFGRIAAHLPPGAVLVAGLLRRDEANPGKVFNSLFVFDDRAEVVARYDKVHLVPFGEYLPFADVLAPLGLEPLTRIFAFVPGARRLPITTPGAPSFSPLICYEVIFPGAVAGEGSRPGFLVNLSDDSWFGDSLGPRQHLHQARVRAAEEGLPLVRATTTGISAVVDGHGRLRASLAMGREGFLDAVLPPALAPTPYSVFGAWVLFALLAGTFTISLSTRAGFSRITM